jgi:uncharacterized protein (TIGR00369 family)
MWRQTATVYQTDRDKIAELMPTMLDQIRQRIAGNLPSAPFPHLAGITVTDVDPGRARMTVTIDDRHWNPMGTMHGGVPCTLADSAMGIAYASTLEEGESFTTLELKINFLRAVRTGTLVAEGVVVQRGRTIGLAECTITDDQGRIVARASSTCMTLRGEQAAGR